MLTSDILVISQTLILVTGIESRHPKKQKSTPHQNQLELSNKVADNSARDSVLKKLFRLIECPVCSDEELGMCEWEALNDSTCEIQEYPGGCGCCPKCNAKEGEFCGFSENPNRPGYAHDLRECESGFECSEMEYNSECIAIEYTLDEDMYISDEDDDDDDEDTDIPRSDNELTINENDESFESLVSSLNLLKKGCEHHRDTVRYMSSVYSTAVGQQVWTPQCQSKNSILYESVQCRSKGTLDEFDCWCVDVESGAPTTWKFWAPNDIDDRICEEL